MKNKRGGLFMLLIIVIVILVIGVIWFLRNMNVETNVNIDLTRKADNTTNDSQTNTQIANPASVKCVEDGYRLELRISKTDGAYGVCIDADGEECEEWSYFREECTLGEPIN